MKKLNRNLRMDFFISLIFGITWFLIPSLVMKNINNETIFIGKSLGLITLISSLWPLFYINKKDFETKKKVFIGKFMCAILTMISFLMIVIVLNKASLGNIISIIMTSFWLANGYYGVKIDN